MFGMSDKLRRKSIESVAIAMGDFNANKERIMPASNTYGTYMNDGVRRIDFVLVYKEDLKESKDENTKEISERRRFFEENVEKGGLDLETDRFDDQKGELWTFVKVHVPWNTLCKYAEELQIKTPLWVRDKPLTRRNSYVDPKLNLLQQIYTSIFGGDEAGNDKKMRLHGKSTIINWPFKRKRIDRYAIRDQRTYFTNKQRIEIAHEILQKIPCNPKELKQRGIQLLVESKIYTTAYALHDCDIKKKSKIDEPTPAREKLHEEWANWKMAAHLQPLTDIRNYFGEKIAFYYGFMDLYTRMLIFPSIVGLVTFVIGLIYAAYNPEVADICNAPSSQASTGELTSTSHLETSMEHVDGFNESLLDDLDVHHLMMCPICKLPDCEAWQIGGWDGCFQYTWAFRLDNPGSFVLSGFTTLWAIIFLKLWKRREAFLAAEWGTEDAEEADIVIRPEYEERAPAQRRNPITLENEPYVPMGKKYLWLSGSVLGTVLVLVFACGCLVLLVLSRIVLYGGLIKIVGNKNIECSRWLTHGFLFITVTILEKAFTFMAEKLTDYECPRTEKQFMNSLLWKVFIFQFLNDFIPLGYAAWLKGKTTSTPLELGMLDELCDGGCMGEVTELVAVLLLLRLVIGNITEIGIPMMKNAWKEFRMKKQGEDHNTVIPQYVQDFHLNEVEYDGVFDDYMEMMVQFMFIVLFVPALPVAPFVCFLNNVAEIRVDAIKMLQTNRRPVPIRTAGIGIWNQFLDIISKSGIICNAALLAFTSDNVPRLYYMFYKSHGQGYVGFTKFSLSKVPLTMFNSDYEMKENGVVLDRHEGCWYPDYRHPFEKYDEQDVYWKIYTFRLVVFAVYCIFFFILMWFINTFVSNVPDSVKTKIKRKQYVVARAIEAETAIKQTKWAKDPVWPQKEQSADC